MNQKKAGAYYLSIGCLILSVLIIVTAVQTNHQAVLVRHSNQTHLKELAQVKKQGQTIQKNSADGLLKGSDAEAIAQHFFQDMFQQLHDRKGTLETKYATPEVCDAFGGAILPYTKKTKEYPISFDRQDIQYSTDLTGESHGMGTLYYKDSGDNESMDVLLSINNGKVTFLELGKITDTTGIKK